MASKIKSFFQNKWTKRCVSIFSVTLEVLCVILAYMSIFYDIEITDFQTFAITIGVFVVVLGAIMIYTRKTFLTSLVAMLVFPLFLPIVIFCWGNWILVVPLLVLSVTIFFICGATENTKIVIGTIYFTFFVMGAIAYFMYSNLIVAQTLDEKSEFYVSETGNYRCYIVDTKDSSTGSTKIYVEPNVYDIHYNGISFIAKDYERIVYNIRERKNVQIDWKEDDLYVDNELRFRSSYAEENEWFVFLDYETRIEKATISFKEICNKITEKIWDKTIFDIPEDEDTNIEDEVSNDTKNDVQNSSNTDTYQEDTTQEDVTTLEDDIQNDIFSTDDDTDENNQDDTSSDDKSKYADYFD